MITALLITGMVLSYLAALALAVVTVERLIGCWLDDDWQLGGLGRWLIAFIVYFFIGTCCCVALWGV